MSTTSAARCSARAHGEDRARARRRDRLETIFEPLQRGELAETGRESLGLGLYIAREIVAAHGGSIDVRSTEQHGTTFTLRLPRSTAAAHPGSFPRHDAPEPLH